MNTKTLFTFTGVLTLIAGLTFLGPAGDAQAQIATGLEVHFPFDGDSFAGSGTSVNGVEVGGPMYTTGGMGRFGEAIVLDNPGDGAEYIEYPLPGGAGGQFTGGANADFTMAAHIWIEPGAINDIGRAWGNIGTPIAGGGVFMNGRMFDLPPTGSGPFEPGSDGDGGFWSGGAPFFIFGTPTDCEGQWCHMALVNDATANTLTLYVNGTADGTHATTGTGLNAIDGLGKVGSNDNQSASNGWPGRIDDFGLWTRALSAGEIATISTSAIGTPGETPTEFTWNKDATGDWNQGTNWTFSIAPSENTHTAIFGDVITSNQLVYTNSDVTVKAIQFDNANRYAIAGHGQVTLEGNSGSSASIDVDQGFHEFQARVALNSNTDVDIATGATLEFNNRVNQNGNTLTKLGGGTLSINHALNSGGGLVLGLEGTITGIGTLAGDMNNIAVTVAPGLRGEAAMLAIPEPTSGLLLVLGAVALCGYGMRRIVSQ